ncbi:MAG: aldehyde dehydrogenase family protein [Treponema sp.]|jgi:succinate-semialdehyde dehydrogenase/glutarate-semialdehyde dehydrogenase|nr:aldehyde dehydrogenase family protein [Treponema sp.]
MKLTPEEMGALLERAREAQRIWAETPCRRRAAILRGAGARLAAGADALTETIHRDNGKLPLDALAAEILPALLAAAYYVKRGRAFLKPRKIRGGSPLMANKQSRLIRKPWGVVGIIAPWNYPFAIPFSEVLMALLAGNAVLLKTASLTPRVGAALEEIFSGLALPPGLFTLVEMPGKDAGPAFIGTPEKPGVDKLFFTGSSATGRELMVLAAPRLLPLVLELGGADAAIVRADANLDRAAAGVIWAGFSNAGQSCGGVQRVIVLRPVYEAFLEKLRRLTQSLRPGVDLGPMATAKQKSAVRAQVENCLAQGARVAAQSPGASLQDEGLAAPAMVLTGVRAGMPIMDEEVFGPVVAVIPAETDEEALALANASPYGLTGSVWSRNRRRARALAARINAGAVMVNDHLMSHGLAETPWGGFGASGLGRTHGEMGFMEMVKTQVIVDDILPGVRRDLFWQPYSDKVYAGIRAVASLASGGLAGRIAALPRAMGAVLRYWSSR